MSQQEIQIQIQLMIYNLLRDINKKYNTTFVIITHDNRIAEKADRVIEVLDGNIIKDYLNQFYYKRRGYLF